MTTEQLNEEKIGKLIAALRGTVQDHIELATDITKADAMKVFPFDQLVYAAINRSLALIDGAILMVEGRNPICAIPLLRLQLDSALRLFACSLLDDVHSAAVPMLRGEKLHNLKVRRARLKSPEHSNGTSEYVQLHDSILHKEFSLIEPSTTRMYEIASGYIHLSGKHIYALFTDIDADAGTVESVIGSPPDTNWKLPEVIEYLEGFLAITGRVLWLAYSWKVQKDKVGNVRLEMAAKGDIVAIDIERKFGEIAT